jgi:hypothetical protein
MCGHPQIRSHAVTLLNAIRTRMHPPTSTGDSEAARPRDLADGYDRLNERDAVAGLAQHNQAELTAIETFERSHRDRPAVLNKLRYLRQREPLAGYDALEPKAIEEALSGSGSETIKAVREYENKLKKRPTALQAIERALRTSRAAQPGTPSRAPALDASQPPVVGNGLPVKVQPGSGVR